MWIMKEVEESKCLLSGCFDLCGEETEIAIFQNLEDK